VIAGDGDGFEPLLLQSGKGVIAPPSLADLTGDGVVDVVVATMEGTIAAFDGVDGAELWSAHREGRETYASPGLGLLTGDDDVPDAFVQLSIGAWPEYTAAEHLLFDGATGALVYERELAAFVSSGPVLADLDDDGVDEVVFGATSRTADDDVSYALYLFRPATERMERIVDAFGAVSMAAPYLGDLDDDGCLDLVVSVSTAREGPEERASTRRWRTSAPARRLPAWGAYLGTAYDGRFTR
jgi:hypothetical protein